MSCTTTVFILNKFPGESILYLVRSNLKIECSLFECKFNNKSLLFAKSNLMRQKINSGNDDILPGGGTMLCEPCDVPTLVGECAEVCHSGISRHRLLSMITASSAWHDPTWLDLAWYTAQLCHGSSKGKYRRQMYCCRSSYTSSHRTAV